MGDWSRRSGPRCQVARRIHPAGANDRTIQQRLGGALAGLNTADVDAVDRPLDRQQVDTRKAPRSAWTAFTALAAWRLVRI